MKVANIGGGRYSLQFGYSPKLVAACKQIPGLTWSPELKAWVGYEDACNEFVRLLPESPGGFLGDSAGSFTLNSEERLRQYQRVGAGYLYGRAHEGVILADVMGLGKSAQAIVAAMAMGGHVLVVCPSFVRGVWRKELQKWWRDAHVLGLEGLKAINTILPDDNVIVCHYDIIHAHVEALLEWGVDTLIIDEAQFLSNGKARRSQAVKVIALEAKNRIALTGTPMTNRPKDLWNIVDTISPGRFGSFFKFAQRYTDAHQDTIGNGPEGKAVWNFDGASNLDELKRRLSYFMLRRTHDDVSLELPEKTRQVIELKVPPGNRLAITRSLGAKDVRRALDIAADGKLSEVAAMLRQHVDDGANVVCFCHRRGIAERLAEECGGEYIHGDVPQKERERRIELCRSRGAGLLATTIDISSVGVDYSFASVGVFAELTYEPTELAQAEARLHRPGATRPVLIQYVIALGTVDELVRQACIGKLDVIEKTVGDPDALAKGLAGPKGDEDALRELFEGLD